MLHRLQLSSPRTSKSLETRVGFPLQDNSVWGMERYSTKWPRFLQQRITKESHEECATFSDNTKGKHGGVGLQLPVFYNFVLGLHWQYS